MTNWQEFGDLEIELATMNLYVFKETRLTIPRQKKFTSQLLNC